MTTTRSKLCAVASLALVVWLPFACGDSGPPGSPDSGVDAGDARVHDAEPDVVDAWVWPDARPDTGWCGENPFPGVEASAIPLTADPPMFINAMSRDGTAIVYSRQHSDSVISNTDVFFFDLLSFSETRITDLADSFQAFPSILENEIVWADSRFSVGSGQYWQELVHYSLSTGIETRLTNSTDSKLLPLFNGHHIVYLQYPSEMTIPELRLLDLQTHEDILLSDMDWKPWDMSISDRYVTWVAIPPWRQDGNRDVFIYDVEAKETLQLDTPTTKQHSTSVHGSRVVWEDTTSGQVDIYVYDIETGEETRLTDDPFDQSSPRILGNLVTFHDYRFTLGWNDPDCAWDIQIMDLDTGVTRRVTSLPWFWHVIPGEGGLLLAKLFEDPSLSNKSKLYMFDLIAMGILDPTGQHVLPVP